MSDGRMIGQEKVTSWSKQASTDYRIGVACKLERKGGYRDDNGSRVDEIVYKETVSDGSLEIMCNG